ncbi:hypothetical protein ACF0H5_014518 [Mactra antiquata]
MWKKVIKTGLIVVAVETTFTDRVACLAEVSGSSMQPSLNPEDNKGRKDWILQNRMAVADYVVHRGDIVTFTMPSDAKSCAIKRVIGVEGDIVRKRKYVNQAVVIPAGHIWVEGDNGRNSLDSNSFGPLPLSLVTSKVTHVIWPPDRWQKLSTDELSCDRVLKQDSSLIISEKSVT